MAHSQKQLYEIAKKLIIFSGKKSTLSESEKTKTLPQLQKILWDLENDSSSIAKRIIKFLRDIIWDIENNRDIDIDSIFEDDYVENYLLADSYVSSYNSLLSHKDFVAIIKCIEQSEYTESLKRVTKLKSRAIKVLKNIPTGRCSQLVLIMNVFQVSNILKHYKELYELSLSYWDIKSARILLDIISLLQEFHSDIHAAAMDNLKNGTIESKYMLCDIKRNKLSFSTLEVTDDINKEIEYKNALLNIFNI